MLALLAAVSVALAPPPAYATVGGKQHRLGQGSYCWSRVCADYAAPRCGDGRTPTIVARKGQLVRFRVGFRATELSLTFLPPRASPRPVELSTRSPSWRVSRGGVFLLFARSAKGWDSAWSGCLRITT